MTVDEKDRVTLLSASITACNTTIQDIVRAKRQGDTDNVAKLTSKGLAQLAEVRSKYFELCQLNDEHKNLAEERKAVDQQTVELHTSRFTHSWLDCLIATNRNFTSKFTDDRVSLRSIEEFEKSLSPAERDMLETATDKEHACMLLRLAKETEQRQVLKAELEHAQSVKKQILADNDKKRKRLEKQVDAHANMRRSVVNSFAELNMDRHIASVDAPALARLSQPLYVLCSQLTNANLVFDLDVKVSMVDAAPGSQNPQRKPDLDAAAAGGPKVLLEIPPRGPAAGIKILFSYISALHIITATAQDPQQTRILDSLYPADAGSTIPHDVSTAAHQSDSPSDLLPMTGKPYKWCQQLAGMDLLLPCPTSSQLPVSVVTHSGHDVELTDPVTQFAVYRYERRATQFVALLRRRLSESSILGSHLSSLSRLQLPQLPRGTRESAPVKGKGKLTTWMVVKDIVTASAPFASTENVAEEEGELDTGDAESTGHEQMVTDEDGDSVLTGVWLGGMHVGPVDAPIVITFHCTVGMFYPSVSARIEISKVQPLQGGQIAEGADAPSLMAQAEIEQLEHVLNVTIPKDDEEDPLPLQLHHLSRAFEAFAQIRRDKLGNKDSAVPMTV